MDATPLPPAETQSSSISSKLNWLRAGVLGANDGIVSTASIIFGVAGADASRSTLMLAGLAAIAAGAMSMASGEYVSVSSQRDVEEAELARQAQLLEDNPRQQFEELKKGLEERGIEPQLSHDVARQLTAQDALAAHASLELGIDPKAVTNPWHAALASMVAFTVGGLVPFIAVLLAAPALEIWLCGGAVVVALLATGWISARLGGAPVMRAIVRNVAGGLVGMAVTYLVGKVAGTHV